MAFGEQRKPLKRNKPLNRGNSQMKRSTLKPRSAKTQKKYREERIPFVKRILSERPVCEACDITPVGARRASVDVHEIVSRGRSGGVLGDAWLDETYVLALCRQCHDWIGRNVAKAEELGLLKKSTN